MVCWADRILFPFLLHTTAAPPEAVFMVLDAVRLSNIVNGKKQTTEGVFAVCR